MASRSKRDSFRDAVEEIQPGGGTNLVAGLDLGYQQVLSNFRKQYTNRVLFLTDGVGESGGIRGDTPRARCPQNPDTHQD